MWRSVFMLKRLNPCSSTLIFHRELLFTFIVGNTWFCPLSHIIIIIVPSLIFITHHSCMIWVQPVWLSTPPSILSFMIPHAFFIINHMESYLSSIVLRVTSIPSNFVCKAVRSCMCMGFRFLRVTSYNWGINALCDDLQLLMCTFIFPLSSLFS